MIKIDDPKIINFTFLRALIMKFILNVMAYILFLGAPGTIRTCDQELRSLLLYPAELRGHKFSRSQRERKSGNSDTVWYHDRKLNSTGVPVSDDITPQPEPSVVPKSNKKPLAKRLFNVKRLTRGFAFLAVVLIGLAGWSYYASKQNKTAQLNDSEKNTTLAPVPSKDRLASYENGVLVAYDLAGNRTKLFSIADDLVPIRVVTDGAKHTLFYMGYDKNPNLNGVPKSIVKTDGTQSQTLATIAGGYAKAAVNADGTKVAYSVSPSAGITSLHVITDSKDRTLSTDTSKLSGKGPLEVVGWTIDGQIVTQQLTCMNCDGPRLAVAQLIDPTSGKISKTYTLSLTADGQISVSNDGKIIVIVAQNAPKSGGTDATLSASSQAAAWIDVASGKQTTVYNKVEPLDTNITLLGWSANNDALYMSITGLDPLSKDAATPIQIFKRLGKLTNDGKVTSINLTVDKLTGSSATISAAIDVNFRLFFVVGNRDSGGATISTMYMLPLTGGENKITTLITDSTKPLVPLNNFTQQ
jgi:hypothetical protein